MQGRNAFVYAITGNKHVAQVNRSLGFLKHYSKQDIVVVAARSDVQINHDQVIHATVPTVLDNHQASILLKTGLHRLVDVGDRNWCYIDSDVFAVHADVDAIFDLKRGLVAFAADQIRLSEFSRYAVRCVCTGGSCDHLRQAIEAKLGVAISEPDWQHWNGGVFVFDAQSTEFLDSWHDSTTSILSDPYWKTRDQGTLIATVWKFGLQNQATLPSSYNYIVDGMRGLNDQQRDSANPSTFTVDNSYSLSECSPTHPRLLHFISNCGQPGWRNWDEAERKLAAAVRLSAPAIEVPGV